MDLQSILLVFGGVVVGISASMIGVGGGFLMVPLLLYMGLAPPKVAGTSFLAILILAVSAVLTHSKLAHVDYKYGLLLGVGAIIGAPIGARLVEMISANTFKSAFAVVIICMAIHLLVSK